MEVQLDPDTILELIRKYSNDDDLGKHIRAYYLHLVELKKKGPSL